MSESENSSSDLGIIVFVGPLILRPLWKFYSWWLDKWIVHDCDKQWIVCHLPCDLCLGWLDRGKWIEMR